MKWKLGTVVATMLVGVVAQAEESPPLEEVFAQYQKECQAVREQRDESGVRERLLRLYNRWAERFAAAIEKADPADPMLGNAMSEAGVLMHAVQRYRDSLAFYQRAIDVHGEETGAGRLIAINLPMVAHEYHLVKPDEMPVEQVLGMYESKAELLEKTSNAGQFLEFYQKYAGLAQQNDKFELAIKLYDEGREFLEDAVKNSGGQSPYSSISIEWFAANAIKAAMLADQNPRVRLQELYDLDGRQRKFSNHLLEISREVYGDDGEGKKIFLLARLLQFDLSSEGGHKIHEELDRLGFKRN